MNNPYTKVRIIAAGYWTDGRFNLDNRKVKIGYPLVVFEGSLVGRVYRAAGLIRLNRQLFAGLNLNPFTS
jgi:hypothetical protein